MSDRIRLQPSPLLVGLCGGVGAALGQRLLSGETLAYSACIGIGVAIGAYILTRYLNTRA